MGGQPIVGAATTKAPASSAPAADFARRRTGATLGLLVVAYLALSLVIPYRVEIPIIDEPIFAESAFEFAKSGRIELNDLAAPTAVFGTVWGGAFSWALEPTYATLRLSTLVLVALSAIPLFVICRAVGAGLAASLIAVAAYLFNPLSLSLAYSFQTDAQAMALGVVAAAFFVLGMADERRQTGLLVVGSVVTGLAFLSRQQSLVVVIGAVLAWLLKGPRGRRGLSGAGAIVLPVLAIYLAHSIWIQRVGEPLMRSLSAADVVAQHAWEILERSVSALVPWPLYMGLFVCAFLPGLWPDRSERKWGLGHPLIVGATVGATMLTLATALGQIPLFANQTWVTISGLGGFDRSSLGWRPELLTSWLQGLATLGLLLAIGSLTIRIGQRLQWSSLGLRGVFMILLGSGFSGAALLSSLAFHGQILDRYWLPLLPFLLAGAAPLLRLDRRTIAGCAAIVVTLGAVGLIGTRDAFVANVARAEFATDVAASGIPVETLDGGAGWLANQFGIVDLRSSGFDGYESEVRPWWVLFYGQPLRPTYAIASEPLEGYEVLEKRTYSSWLHLKPTALYLLHRDSEDGFYILGNGF